MKSVVLGSLLSLACAAFALTLENPSLRLVFAEAEGGYAVERIENRLAGGTDFVNSPAKGASFWELAFWNEGAPGDAKAGARLTNLSPCRVKSVERHADGGATFVWRGLDLPGEKGAVTVRATVRFAVDGASRWSLEVQNASTVFGLAETKYPYFSHVSKSGEADVLQPRPDTGARLVRNRPWGGRWAMAGCGGYMPMMMAFLKDGAGLYVAAHDPEARIKTQGLSPEHDLTYITPVENAGIPGKAAEGPRYEVTVAAFKGDWWAAARKYRAWALTTKWASKGRILDRADYPRRLAEIPLWLNIHAYPDEVSNTMSRVHALFPGFDAGIHWHLWQHSPHDVNYPEYFPEQKGTRACLAFCRSIGAEAMPYTNGRLWSVPLMSYPYAKPYAIAKPDGGPRIEKYGPVTPPLSPMCPYTDKWDETLNDFSRRVLELGAGSVFLDQIGACAASPCYAKDHGHPVGGGAWYFEGYQRLLAKTHAVYSATNAFVTTEGSGEQWMNVVDGYLNVTQRQPDDVPFFHAVYSGYTTYFCSPENHEDDDASFRAAQTRELLWGQSLGWFHPLILDKPSKCAIVRELCEFRQAHLDCFAYGTLLGEVAFEQPVPEIPLTWLGRKPFWAWRLPDYPLSATITGKMPGLLGYVWESAKDGRKTAFLANLTDAPRTVSFAWQGVRKTVDLPARGLLPTEVR
ncbi:MAG: DUF6259 domain-containing protein [Kiritimatiellae bacterium]|nr:DUF6259 domain-containing protein [Kiritimatiellia bacterium]